MRLVIDASIGLKWELPEPDSDKANQLREAFRNGIHELIAPECFILEVAHVLTKAERQKKIPDAESLYVDIMTTCPDLHAVPPLLLRAIRIARKARIGVHDCLYVALAEREGCDLITSDSKLIKNLQTTFSFIRPLSTF
jgi:predicted nucleic acid-binding protein